MQTENIDENNLVQDRKYLLDESLISIIQYFYPSFHGNSTCAMMLSCKGWVDAHIILYLCEFFSWPPATLNKPASKAEVPRTVKCKEFCESIQGKGKVIL